MKSMLFESFFCQKIFGMGIGMGVSASSGHGLHVFFLQRHLAMQWTGEL